MSKEAPNLTFWTVYSVIFLDKDTLAIRVNKELFWSIISDGCMYFRRFTHIHYSVPGNADLHQLQSNQDDFWRTSRRHMVRCRELDYMKFRPMEIFLWGVLAVSHSSQCFACYPIKLPLVPLVQQGRITQVRALQRSHVFRKYFHRFTDTVHPPVQEEWWHVSWMTKSFQAQPHGVLESDGESVRPHFSSLENRG